MSTSTARQITETPFNPAKQAGAYNPVPRIIDRRRDISEGAKRVYGYLAGCYGADGEIFPTIRRIAFELAKGERQVSAALEELRRKNLIDSIRTGRANVYRFIPLGDSGGRSARPCLSLETDTRESADHDLRETADQHDRHLIENKKQEKATTPAVVVSLDPVELHTAMDAIRADVAHTKPLRRTIREGIAEHGLDHVLRAIAYVNDRSRTNYGAYLSKAISAGWADGWTPQSPQPPQQDPAEKANQELTEAAAFDRERAELIEARVEASRRFDAMPTMDQICLREQFLSDAQPFTRRRCEKLDLAELGKSTAFVVWFAGR